MTGTDGAKPARAGWRRIVARMALTSAVLAGAGLDAAPAGAGVADETFLQQLAGSWKGRGKLRPSATARAEPVSCRMDATWNGGGKSLSISMSCRGVDVSFTSSGFLQTLARNNVVEGRWSGGFGVGTTSVSGRRSGNSLNLTMTSRDQKSGGTIRTSVSLRLSGNGRLLRNSVNSQEAGTGRSYQALTLSMSK